MSSLPYNHPTIRARVWDITSGRCAYCGVQTNPFRNFTIDHVIPRCLGGSDDITNLLPCCTSCNSAKSGTHPIRWLHTRRTWLGSDEFAREYEPRLRALHEEEAR